MNIASEISTSLTLKGVLIMTKQRHTISQVIQKSFSSSPASATYMRRWTGPLLVQKMACRLVSAMPSSQPNMEYC